MYKPLASCRAPVAAASVLFLAAVCASAQEVPLPPGFDGFMEGERIAVAWRTADGSQDEVREFIERATLYFEALEDVLGPERTPEDPVLVALGGSGRAADGTFRFPNVDREGRILMFEFTGQFADHIVEFPHELVHAFRRKLGYWHSGFWEEGFAEAISMEVYPDDEGFPRYGFPLDVAAGHLLAQGEYIPLADIRDDHSGVGQACQLQAYLERASFFRFLVEERGVASLVELAYGEVTPTDSDYERVYGQPFSELVAAWEAALLEAYSSIPDAEDQARRYRELAPIRSRRICG